MSEIIPISIAKYTEEYRKISEQLDALSLAILEVQMYESELQKRKIKLEAARRQLEAKALESLSKEGKS